MILGISDTISPLSSAKILVYYTWWRNLGDSPKTRNTARLRSPSRIMDPVLNYLITASEVVTGKSQTEALPYWPSDNEVNTVGRGLRFPVTTERSRLLSCLLYGSRIKEKRTIFERKSWIYIRRCARLPIHSLSRTWSKLNYTVGEFHLCITYSVKKHTFPYEPQKGILVLWCHNLMGEYFPLLWQNVNV